MYILSTLDFGKISRLSVKGKRRIRVYILAKSTYSSLCHKNQWGMQKKKK